MDNFDHKEQSKGTSEDKEAEVCSGNDTGGSEAVGNMDSKDEVGTQEVISDAKEENNGDLGETMSKESVRGTNETPVECENIKISGRTETDEDSTKISENVTVLNTKDTPIRSEEDVTESNDTVVKPKANAKSDEGTTKPEGDATNTEGDATNTEGDATNTEGDAVKPEYDVIKSKNTTTKLEGDTETSEEKPKDEFEEVAESIKDAEIGIDGTEKSPEVLLRRLSINSKTEIMDKFVKLRVLKQNLKVRCWVSIICRFPTEPLVSRSMRDCLYDHAVPRRDCRIIF